jgi:hypothetical protein
VNAHAVHSIYRRRDLVPLTAFLLLSAVAFFGFVGSEAQSGAKQEREVAEKIPKHLPIKAKVKKPERLKDAENEDWLGEVELEVTNTGTKPIYHLEIVLDLPDVVAPNGLNIAWRLEYGRGELISLSEPVRPDDVPIQPGGVVILSVPTARVENWKRARVRGTLTNPKKIEFFFQHINFGDGTGFVGTGGKPLPDRKESGANATCPGGDNSGAAASITDPPRYNFPELASLLTVLPPPANLVPAFFIPKPSLPKPVVTQDLCCAAGCSRLKVAQDQGCPCPGVTRRIVQPASCSDPDGSCGTIMYRTMDACTADGVEHYCEESFIDTTCAAPTPMPTPCTPAEPRPHFCCTPERYQPDPTLPAQPCRWNCRAGEA